MKMIKKDYESLKADINLILENQPSVVQLYESGDFIRSEHVKDLQVRFVWDLFYALPNHREYADHFYTYLHDAHIQTALKKICPAVTRNY
jgi:hypothetical protein